MYEEIVGELSRQFIVGKNENFFYSSCEEKTLENRKPTTQSSKISAQSSSLFITLIVMWPNFDFINF